MRVLVACEFSGRVRDAFAKRGHYSISCDYLPSETPGCHHFGDVLEYLKDPIHRFDLMIAHPPCTYLCSSGARWWKERPLVQKAAIKFFMDLVEVDIPRIAIENPIGIMSTRYRKPDQIIQPWQFGHGEIKATCLWLKGLPPLQPTEVVEGREARIHRMSPGPNRGRERSRTYCGIAEAMADQWGTFIEQGEI